MHKKKIVKIISIVFIIIYILSFSVTVLGQEIDPIAVIGNGPDPSSGGVRTLYYLVNIILGILQYIGVGTSVIACLVLAVKYMYTSPDDKAEVKKKLVPVIIGVFLVFGAVQLVKLVEIFTKEIT